MSENCQVCGQPIRDPTDTAEIERLTAENERLMAHLQEILHLHDTDTDADTYTTLALIAQTAQEAMRSHQQQTNSGEDHGDR